MWVCSRVSYSGVATSLVNPSLLSHSRFSANPDGRIVLLCSAQPRSAGFEPVGRGPTLGFHIPGLGGPGLCRSGSLYLVYIPFVKFLLTIFRVRVPFDLTFVTCCFQHSLLSSSIPKYGWCSTGASTVPPMLYWCLITLRLRVIWRTWHFVVLNAIFQRLDHRWSELRSPFKTQPSASVLIGWYSKASSAKRRICPFMSFVISLMYVRNC